MSTAAHELENISNSNPDFTTKLQLVDRYIDSIFFVKQFLHFLNQCVFLGIKKY